MTIKLYFVQGITAGQTLRQNRIPFSGRIKKTSANGLRMDRGKRTGLSRASYMRMERKRNQVVRAGGGSRAGCGNKISQPTGFPARARRELATLP